MYTILVHEPETKIGPVGTILGGEEGGGGQILTNVFGFPIISASI